MAAATAYEVTLDPTLNEDLSNSAKALGISKEEAMRRALELLKHAAQAEKVELTLRDGRKQAVRLK
jgi:ABC-type arginine transport system ATPase subunit